MDYDEFINKVQEYAELGSREEAVQSTEVTLRTISERLSSIHRKQMAAQLPGELKNLAVRRQNAEIFSVEDFYIRVSARAQITFHQAIKNARAVMCVLQEAISPGELHDIFSELHDGWEELYRPKAPGPISPDTVDTHELFRR